MNCPLPRYYLCHAVVALLIAAAVWPVLGLVAGLAAGTAFSQILPHNKRTK